MTRQELIDLCLTFPDAYEDYPFDEVKDELMTTMLDSAKETAYAEIMQKWTEEANVEIFDDKL